MIKVKFFASIRESLGVEGVEISLEGGEGLVKDVVDEVCRAYPNWEEVLLDSKVLVALNQEMTRFGAAVTDGDEVALFPPVTGG